MVVATLINAASRGIRLDAVVPALFDYAEGLSHVHRRHRLMVAFARPLS